MKIRNVTNGLTATADEALATELIDSGVWEDAAPAPEPEPEPEPDPEPDPDPEPEPDE